MDFNIHRHDQVSKQYENLRNFVFFWVFLLSYCMQYTNLIYVIQITHHCANPTANWYCNIHFLAIILSVRIYIYMYTIIYNIYAYIIYIILYILYYIYYI